MIVTRTICDVCENDKEVCSKNINIIFTTEQTEGRSVEPYLSLNKIDICVKCLAKVISGNMLFGEGAMGHNRYYFKVKE